MKKMETQKEFDAVQMMRKIRDKIDHDIAGMTFEEEKEHFKRGATRAKRYKAMNNLKSANTAD